MAVQVQQEHLDHCRVALTVEVPPEEIQKARETVFNQFAKRTNVPGFRPGKAPRHLVQRYIDEDRVRDMALEQALTNAYRDALRQAGVEPYRFAEPQVELQEEEIDAEKGFSFKATIALPPHVHLGEVEGLTGRRVVTKIGDEEVDRELARMREQGATFEATEEGAEEGDRIRATVEVLADGERVDDASFTEPTLIQVGANLEQFDAGVKGAKASEERTFDLTFPEDYPSEVLRGKTAQATVRIIEVLRRAVPEADDAFAQRAGLQSLEELQTLIREALQRQADAVAEQELNEGLVQELIKRSTAHFPDEMLERQVSSRMAELMQALERRGLTLDDYLQAEKTDLTAFQERLREEAAQALTNTLVLIEFAAANDLKVTDREVEQEVKRRAEEENVKPSQMRKLLNDTGEIDVIRHRLLYRKVADFLREKAEIREVEA